MPSRLPVGSGRERHRLPEGRVDEFPRRRRERVGSPRRLGVDAVEELAGLGVVGQAAAHPAEQIQGDDVTGRHPVDVSRDRVAQRDLPLVDELQDGGSGERLGHAADAGDVVDGHGFPGPGVTDTEGLGVLDAAGDG
jgi:hypothetical protein